MNYYDHYIADYQSKTAHLTLAEHGAYFLMLQSFYASERSLPKDRKILFRLLRAESKIEREAIESVIRQYWLEGTDGLTNKRAAQVVEEYREWVGKQRANGKRGGKPKHSDGLANASPNGGDSTSYSDSDTTSHTTSHTKLAPPNGVGHGARVGTFEKAGSGWKPPTEEEIRAGK